jgi:quercetin dioxygenase-like cupin family protein
MTTPPRDRPHGETSGSEQRPARSLAEPAMSFDIESELVTLKQESSWTRGDRNARTLVEQGGFRLVLTALKSGARLRPHQTPGWVSIHCTHGHLKVRAAERETSVPSGHVLVLARDEPHDVEALEESAFLLTVAGLERRQGSDGS